MSMYELESLFECSGKLIADSDLGNKREWVRRLYQIVSQYDISYIHFRIKKELEEMDYFYSLPIVDIPGYSENKEKYDKIKDKLVKSRSGDWYNKIPLLGESKEYIYFKEDDMYYDYGSDIWGKLHPDEKIKSIGYENQFEFIFQLILIAKQNKSAELVFNLTGFLFNFGLLSEELVSTPADEIIEKYIKEIKSIYNEMACNDSMGYHRANMTIHDPEEAYWLKDEIKLQKVLNWWWDK